MMNPTALHRLLIALATFSSITATASVASKRVDARCKLVRAPLPRTRAMTVLLAVPTSDTVLAGAGPVSANGLVGHSGSGAPGPIYGQVVDVQKFGGADSARLAARFDRSSKRQAIVVPWGYDPACEPARWTSSFAWMQRGQPGTLKLQLRPDSVWVNGVPVFDAFRAELEPYPFAFRSAPVAADDEAWLTPAQYFALLVALPPRENWLDNPDSSWKAVLAWQASNPDLARKALAASLVSDVAGGIANARAVRMIRSIAPPIAGTFRMSIALDNEPARTFYMRTHAHPASEWRSITTPRQSVDPGSEPRRAEAYNVLTATALTAEELQSDCSANRDMRKEGWAYLIDPVVDGVSARTEWRGWLEVTLVTRPFSGDQALESFRRQEFAEWGARHRGTTELEAPARFWHDKGILKVEQTLQLRDGRTLIVRGERISPAVIACSW